MRKLLGTAAATAAVLTGAPAQAVTLTFDAGQLDVRYDAIVGDAAPLDPLSWWGSSYSDLSGVAWGGAGDASGVAEILLRPLAGYQVTLQGFDLGAYPNTDRTTQVTIRSLAGGVLATSGTFTVDGDVRSSLAYDITRTDGIRIQWGPNAYSVGIDNVRFTVSQAAIPEPASWAMMILGFGAAGGVMRRNRWRLSAFQAVVACKPVHTG